MAILYILGAVFTFIACLFFMSNSKKEFWKPLMFITYCMGIFFFYLIGYVNGFKGGHIEMYRENPHYEMKIWYDENLTPVDTLFLRIK